MARGSEAAASSSTAATTVGGDVEEGDSHEEGLDAQGQTVNRDDDPKQMSSEVRDQVKRMQPGQSTYPYIDRLAKEWCLPMMRAFANTSIDDTLGASLAWNRPLHNEDRRMEEHVRSAKAFIASKKKVEQKESTKKEDIEEMDELRATHVGQVMNATLKPLLAMQTAINEARTEDGKRGFNATPPGKQVGACGIC